jgi:hypothetical protein
MRKVVADFFSKQIQMKWVGEKWSRHESEEGEGKRLLTFLFLVNLYLAYL